VLSGPGLVNLYRAIVKSDGRLPENLQPKDVTERALADTCIDCRRALSLFCVIMGRFGGNLALTLATFGGVYIAGGIVPRFLEFFKASGFRGGFEDKGRFKAFVQDIPVYLIVHDNPGLLGSGAHLRQTLGRFSNLVIASPFRRSRARATLFALYRCMSWRNSLTLLRLTGT
jgi:glucokinase